MGFKMECQRCGTCCAKGGPVLHHEDRSFLQKNIVTLDNLRVIRKGELSFNPLKDKVEPAEVEMLKLAGPGTSWECPFHQKNDTGSECLIHTDRPVECSLLKCWDTKDIEAIIFKGCLTRFDLLGEQTPLLPEIVDHEERCSYRQLWSLRDGLKDGGDCIDKIQTLLGRDLQIRQRLVAQYSLTLAQELFYLGQPMFRGCENSDLSISFDNEELKVGYAG